MLNFLAVVVLTALIAPVLLFGWGIKQWHAGKRRLPGLLFSAGTSVLVYAFSLFWFVVPVDFAKGCGNEAIRWPRNANWFEQRVFPLTATCHWNSGRTYSFVPAFVNPLIYACIAATLVCAVIVIRDKHRNGHTS
ncbi:hypothetical protein [Streptomyces sp. NBC_00986]|uniref:hypothetical protein n=1 Tax=Streptomyces sp. NBC_00986 TaxID=2903702 RepID=UPI003867D3C0|nr:hypothetical protein OG504_26405 [Streptomyces sp. NBC_00986]